MKPPAFDYVRPASVDEALEALVREGAQVLAGGQSLVPQLSAGSASPSVLVDLAGVAGLDALVLGEGELIVSAMVRQRSAELSPLVRAHCPLLALALQRVGHVAVRTQGTVLGSLVQAMPRAEVPTAAVALGARVRVVSPAGERFVSAADLIDAGGHLGPQEIAVDLRVPIGFTGASFAELSRRYNDLPIVGVAVAARRDGSDLADIRVASGSAAGVWRWPGVEAAIGRASTSGSAILDTGDIEAVVAEATRDVAALGRFADSYSAAVLPSVLRSALESL